MVLHEALPGHLLQMHVASESTTLSPLRRRGGWVAFSEGWAHYASGLASELGLQPYVYALAERGTGELFMSVRAVIETGLHGKGWTREEAAAYYKNTLPWSPVARIDAELDAAMANPGRRLAYMVGQQKFLQLRRFAEQQLGSRFDVRAFHDEVLKNGQVPLEVLDHQVREWVANWPLALSP